LSEPIIEIKIKKKTIARWLDRISWFCLGAVTGWAQGDWTAYFCYLPIFVIMQLISKKMKNWKSES